MKEFDDLYQTILMRRDANPKDSYVAELFSEGRERIAQKLGEEATEAVIAAISGDKEELVNESVDVIFHLLVLLVESGIELDDIAAEILRRSKLNKSKRDN